LDSYLTEEELKIINRIAELQSAPAEGNAEYTFSDGRQYNGMWLDHYPHCQGTTRYKNGKNKHIYLHLKKSKTWDY
jgi:hypothetical protein